MLTITTTSYTLNDFNQGYPMTTVQLISNGVFSLTHGKHLHDHVISLEYNSVLTFTWSAMIAFSQISLKWNTNLFQFFVLIQRILYGQTIFQDKRYICSHSFLTWKLTLSSTHANPAKKITHFIYTLDELLKNICFFTYGV